jgi:multiple sugar transport system permease protein
LRRHSTGNGQQAAGVAFTAPVPIFLLLFILFPLISNIQLSLTDQGGKFVGFAHYLDVLTDASIWASALVTTIYVCVSVIFQIALGTVTAIVINQNLKGKAFYRSAILIPWVVPASVAATTWAWMYHPAFGVIALAMDKLGILVKMGLLSTPDTVILALAFVNVWKMFPFVAVMVLAGLQAIDLELYEAATMDGATILQKTRYITLPFLRNVLFSLLILLTIWGFNGITIIYTMTRGGPADLSLVLPIHIYRTAFQYFHLNVAAAESVFLFAVLAVLIAIYLKSFGPRGEAE